MITLQGYITAFEITPASVDDRERLQEMADHFPFPKDGRNNFFPAQR